MTPFLAFSLSHLCLKQRIEREFATKEEDFWQNSFSVRDAGDMTGGLIWTLNLAKGRGEQSSSPSLASCRAEVHSTKGEKPQPVLLLTGVRLTSVFLQGVVGVPTAPLHPLHLTLSTVIAQMNKSSQRQPMQSSH